MTSRARAGRSTAMTGRRRASWVAAAVAAVMLVAGCQSGSAGRNGAGAAPGSGSTPAAATTTPPIATCGAYAEPDPNRPRMTLDFTIADDHRTVTGTETIRFRPDLPVSELVLRLTANTRDTVEGENKITVTSATADHGARGPRYTRANAAAGTQGGLLHLDFPSKLAAGTVVTARLAFTVALGKPYFDRFGTAGRFAYFGSAEPLLSWQRGVGWHDEDLSYLSTESATSEAMSVDLTVHAPGRDTVIMSGDPATPASSTGVRTWHAHLATARDVSVAVGPFVVSDETVGAVRLHVGAPSTAQRDAAVRDVRRAVTQLESLFGPFPFPSLSVARLPVNGGGIEYPSSIFLFNGGSAEDRSHIAVHETAHQWFYAMIGNSQASHPWLDEAFATYAEDIVDGQPDHPEDLRRKGNVDATTNSYGTRIYPYFNITYLKGAAALRAARDAAGHAAWDQALRCYVAKNAWRIVVPRDFERAIAQFPAAVAVLRRAGALP